MKHLFVIHSNITYLASLATIIKEKINLKDVIIISRLKLEGIYPIPIHYLPFAIDYKHLWRSSYLFSPYKYIDRFIDNYVCDDYIAYLAAMTLQSKLIVSNNHCKGFHFIEEGNASHLETLSMSLLSFDDVSDLNDQLRPNSFKRRLKDLMLILSGVGLKNLSLPFHSLCYYNVKGVRFFGFGESSFKYSRTKTQIEWSDIINNYSFTKKYHFSGNSIWIGTSANNIKSIQSIDKYCEGIMSLCVPDLKKKGISKIYLKHHPISNKECRRKEVEVFTSAGIVVDVINDDVCLEMELMGESDVNIYMLLSSICNYAYQMGHRNLFSIGSYFPEFVKEMDVDDWDNIVML